MSGPFVAIGRRLARFPWITTLGARPNLQDYSAHEMELIRRAPRIYYPTMALAETLSAMGKPIFPSLECHLMEGDKIKQTRLLNLLDIPHPRTRVFFGRQREEILDHFSFPFVAKTPRASSGGLGVWLIGDRAGLDAYLENHPTAYIQEYLPMELETRVVVLNFEPLVSYLRVAAEGNFRVNLAQGGRVEFQGVPREAVDLAVKTARLANLDDVGVDVAQSGGKQFILELNFLYGRKGPHLAGIDPVAVVAEKIRNGEL